MGLDQARSLPLQRNLSGVKGLDWVFGHRPKGHGIKGYRERRMVYFVCVSMASALLLPGQSHSLMFHSFCEQGKWKVVVVPAAPAEVVEALVEVAEVRQNLAAPMRLDTCYSYVNSALILPANA